MQGLYLTLLKEVLSKIINSEIINYSRLIFKGDSETSIRFKEQRLHKKLFAKTFKKRNKKQFFEKKSVRDLICNIKN